MKREINVSYSNSVKCGEVNFFSEMSVGGDYYCIVIIISDSGPLVARLKTYLLKILGFNQANNFLLNTSSCSPSKWGEGRLGSWES